MSDLESNLIVKNRWGDMAQLDNDSLKIMIKEGRKSSAWGEPVPEHPRGKFSFKVERLKIDEIKVTATNFSGGILTKKFGFIHIRSSMMKQYVKFPFDSDNKGWKKFADSIVERVTYNAKRAILLEKTRDYAEAVAIWRKLRKFKEVKRLRKLQIEDLKISKEYDKAITFAEEIEDNEEVQNIRKLQAKEREDALDYETAIKLWEELGLIQEAARVRKLQATMGSVKVAQKVVHGDTIVKDSVLNRTNIGSDGDDKFTRLEKLTEMKEKGLIDDDEFKQMKKEILGK